MYNGLLHAHSGLRWLAALFLLIATVKAFIGWLGNKEYTKIDNLIAILLVSFIHTMAVIGIILYFVSPNVLSIKESMSVAFSRFWAMEHPLMMLIAVVLITVGRVKSKKSESSLNKHKKAVMFYLIALLLILWAGVIQPILLKGTFF